MPTYSLQATRFQHALVPACVLGSALLFSFAFAEEHIVRDDLGEAGRLRGIDDRIGCRAPFYDRIMEYVTPIRASGRLI
jgi:hypothetical protein